MNKQVKILLQTTIPFTEDDWYIGTGCPTFLVEPPGNGFKKNPKALNDVKGYVENAAGWPARN